MATSSSLFGRLREWFDTRGVGARLSLTLLPLVMIPLLLLGVVSYTRARQLLLNGEITNLTQAASGQADQLESWRSTRETRIQAAIQSQDFRTAVEQILTAQPESPSALELQRQIDAQLQDINSRLTPTLFTGMLVVRLSDGFVLASIPANWQGLTYRPSMASPEPQTFLAQQISLPGAGSISIVSSIVIQQQNGPMDAALVGVLNDARLVSLMEETSAMQMPQGEASLVIPPDTVMRVEPQTMAPGLYQIPDHPAFQLADRGGTATYQFTSFDNTPVVAVGQWLPGWQAALVVEQAQATAFAALNSLAPFSAALILLAAALVFLIVPWATRRSLRPLDALSDFAERLAQGDLSYRAPGGGPDEIGRLGQTMNSMADELSSFYDSLEARVAERTEQMRTAAEVARDSAAVQDVDTLLKQAVNLISERFGFYHAGVFLLDKNEEYAYLRAASSEGGQRMLAREHKLAVGKVGIVGYVTGTGRPRIALDVGTDAVHFANPDLPETRSEMALPLRVGDHLLGALDVQSGQPNAFEESDVVVLQTMADQIAVAIQNANLLQEQTHLADQRRRVIRFFNQLSQQLSYDRLIKEAAARIIEIFDFQQVRIALAEGDGLVLRSSVGEGPLGGRTGEFIPLGRGLLGRAAHTRGPVHPEAGELESDAAAATATAVPLLYRGQVLGALAVAGDPGRRGEMIDTELVELIAGQLSVALENARLFEEMQLSLQQVETIRRRQTADAWGELTTRLQGESSNRAMYGRSDPQEVVSGGSEVVRAPIELRGEIIGALGVKASRVGDLEGDEEAAILQAVANEVAGALEQARLLDEVNRRAAHLQVAAEVARQSTVLTNLDSLLARVTELIRLRLNLYYVSVFLTDDSGTHVVLHQGTGQAGQVFKARQHRFEFGSGTVVGQAAAGARHYLVPDVSQDPYFKPNSLLPETRSELCLPLRIGDQAIGVLDIQQSKTNAFSEDDISILETMADQLAIAVQNARLFEDTVQRSTRDQAVLEISSKIRGTERVDSMAQIALQEMRKALGATRAQVRIHPTEGQAPAAGRGSQPPMKAQGNGHPGSGQGSDGKNGKGE
jgi:GAF domain-containing protein/HAMP domain-containing protein